jgi:hypothetical protein
MRVYPSEIQTIGEGLQNKTTAGPNGQTTAQQLSGGPLGEPVMSAHNTKAPQASAFLTAVQQGMAQAAHTLVQLGQEMQNIDQSTSYAIKYAALGTAGSANA